MLNSEHFKQIVCKVFFVANVIDRLIYLDQWHEYFEFLFQITSFTIRVLPRVKPRPLVKQSDIYLINMEPLWQAPKPSFVAMYFPPHLCVKYE